MTCSISSNEILRIPLPQLFKTQCRKTELSKELTQVQRAMLKVCKMYVILHCLLFSVKQNIVNSDCNKANQESQLFFIAVTDLVMYLQRFTSQ